MDFVSCGGSCGLWRFWVVVEVVACFVGFVGMGMDGSGLGCRIESGMWVSFGSLGWFCWVWV